MKLNKALLLLLTSALLLRLALSFWGTLQLDQGTFIAWSNILVEGGLKNFYHNWSDYLPGYLYVLWLLGKIHQLIPLFPEVLLYKLPAILADLGVGYLIFRLAGKKKILFSALYLFNPAILANSTFWGQVDGLTALFSLLAVFLAGKYWWFSAVCLGLGVAVKPQAALAALPLLFIILRDKWSIKKDLAFIFLAFGIFILLFLPFNDTGNFFWFAYSRILATLNQYPYTSVNAFSFWGLRGFWQPDRWWATAVGYLVILAAGLFVAFKKRKTVGGEYLVMAVVFLTGFLFQTRMHERHLLPSLVPLLISAVICSDLLFAYLIFSITYLANMYYAFVWITDNFKSVFPPEVIIIFILVNLVTLFFVFRSMFRRSIINWQLKLVDIADSFPPVKLSRRLLRLTLLGVLLFSLAARIAWIWTPREMYFDEVYHAFTAKLVLHGDPKAWEWWNPHPTGFAYEWTHPPVAKLGMALGMKIFGENAVGWRLPGVMLGVGCVYLVYLLAKEIFKDELVGLLSAAVFSLDGLVLTMSRIGMNDTYFLFFTLLSLCLFLKDKNFFSAFAFGLALASKWTAVYSAPIFLVAFLVFGKRFRISYLWFLILPPLVYLASYFQLFLTGHDLSIWWGMQKQMWWYHTGLKATHAYTSKWYSWPLDLRPVYLYTTDEVNGWVARIYNLGNPAVFWAGLTAICYLLASKTGRRVKLILFAYFIFFVPWALSPRIMFFYHYLPSLPFLAIALGYTLRKNLKFVPVFYVLCCMLFIYFYPHWAGLQVPLWLDKSYYWISTWR